jgi:hypothetical protein
MPVSVPSTSIPAYFSSRFSPVADLDRSALVLHAELPLGLLDGVVADGLERGGSDLAQVGDFAGALAVDDQGRGRGIPARDAGTRLEAVGLSRMRRRNSGRRRLMAS